MALPQAIQRQEAEAEAIRRAAYEAASDPDTPPEPPAEPAVVQPDPTPAPAAPDPASNVVDLPTPAEPVKAATPPVPQADDVAYWKKRFETVQGKLDAEFPRLFQQIREQGETIAKLSQQLAAKDTPPPAPKDSLVTQQDIDNFGEDLVDFARRAAQEEAEKAFAVRYAELEKRFGTVTSKVERVETRVAQSDVDKFWSEVIRLAPDWPLIDQNPAWVLWLDTTPEFTTATYRELASQAIQKGDAQKITKLVDTWKKSAGYVAPQEQPAVASTPPQPSPQADLSRQVAPSTVKSDSATPASKRMLTRTDYEALYDVRNVQRYGEKKAAEMIAEADAAVAEGRVKW